MPAPQKEHEWLKQLEGEWESEDEVVIEPGKPPVKSKGTESARSAASGSSAEKKGECMGTPFTGIMTMGYDAEKKKYVGTWVCSMCDLRLWKYERHAGGRQGADAEHRGPRPTPRASCQDEGRDRDEGQGQQGVLVVPAGRGRQVGHPS